MNFSSEYEIDAEHEVDSTPTNGEECAFLAIPANNPLTNKEWIAHCTKEIKANKELEQQIKQRVALEGREEASEWWASPVSVYILFRTFGLQFPLQIRYPSKLAINRLLLTESKERQMCNFSRNFKKI